MSKKKQPEYDLTIDRLIEILTEIKTTTPGDSLVIVCGENLGPMPVMNIKAGYVGKGRVMRGDCDVINDEGDDDRFVLVFETPMMTPVGWLNQVFDARREIASAS